MEKLNATIKTLELIVEELKEAKELGEMVYTYDETLEGLKDNLFKLIGDLGF